MLATDEYLKDYYSKDRRALQLTKYYLSKWGIIEKNASKLDESYKERAFLLFSALNEMTEEERKFLADKYRVIIFNMSAKPDKELAEEYDMEFSEYKKLRIGVEYKFYYYLKPLIQKNKRDQGIDFNFG